MIAREELTPQRIRRERQSERAALHRMVCCSCGYPAVSEDALDDHIVYMARIGDTESHRPVRRTLR